MRSPLPIRGFKCGVDAQSAADRTVFCQEPSIECRDAGGAEPYLAGDQHIGGFHLIEADQV